MPEKINSVVPEDYSRYANERVAMETKVIIGIQSFLSVLSIALIQLLTQQGKIEEGMVGYILPLTPVTSTLISMLLIYLFHKKIAIRRCKSDFKALKERLNELIATSEKELKQIEEEDARKDLEITISNLKKRKNRLKAKEMDELQKILKIG